jgi:hypothetical protein
LSRDEGGWWHGKLKNRLIWLRHLATDWQYAILSTGNLNGQIGIFPSNYVEWIHSYTIMEINTTVVPSMTRMQLGEVRYGSMHVQSGMRFGISGGIIFPPLSPIRKHGGWHRLQQSDVRSFKSDSELFVEKKKNWIG